MDTALRNQIVAHFSNGQLLKGVTNDFLPHKDQFHVTPAEAPPGARPVEVRVAELKALFFVKAFGGKPGYKDRQEFEPGKVVSGRKIRVVFKDGERLIGTTQGYQPGRAGFFVIPADPQSNVDRCFVVSGSTTEVAFL